MVPRLPALVLALVGACGHHPNAPTYVRATTGDLAGLARDRESGDPVAHADLRLRAQGQLGEPTRGTTGPQGLYAFAHLAPGTYDLVAEFAGQPVEVSGIHIGAGEATIVDVTFTLGHPDPVHVVFGDPKAAEIVHYHPPKQPPQASVIEGAVSDIGTKERIAGVSINIIGDTETQQGITDDQGRYRFDVRPGVYVVAAIYSIVGHADVEVRRSDIHVDGGEAVRVPLWIETDR